MKKIFLSALISIFFVFNLYSKGYYIITLKGGTKIKSESIIKYDGYIKVYKYGGYILYPRKSIKSIKYVKEEEKEENSQKKSNSVKAETNKCLLKIKDFSAKPTFNKELGIYNVIIKGIIANNCPKPFKNVSLIVEFLGKNREILHSKKITFEEVGAYTEVKVNKKYEDVNADNVKFYKYKLEYLREK